ncbi:hypothetical protein PybrP1_002063 [[Pythium] brassicae (nom. inval.)]|nr:hypothetical protein PybrP1_002063 [[Pythium] brassicae (nom. inval.)]
MMEFDDRGDERSPLLPPPPQSQRAAARRAQRAWQALAFLLSAALLTVLLWEMTPYAKGSEPTPASPAHVRRDPKYPFARFFATKTAYWDQRDGAESNQELLTAYENALLREDLELRQSHVIVRHGIRFPTADSIEEIEALLATLKRFGSLAPAWLRSYSLPYNASVESELGAAGKQEMRDLGRRMVLANGHAEPVTYNASKARVRHTHATRTKKSAQAYVGEFFANPDDVEFVEFPKGHDPLLRFYDSCPRYQREVKENASAIAQWRAFERSQLLSAARDALVLSLGFQNSSAAAAAITAKEVQAAFSACAFDYALYGITDQWCSLLSEALIVSVDYLDDLRAFYELAGGYAINYEMAAVLLQDVVAGMRGRLNRTNNLHAIADFAHAETTLPLMTLLGYTDRSPLLATTTLAAIEAREFRASVFAPFGANIEFRLFTRKSNDEQHFVQVLVNEQEREIPGCEDVYCDFAKVERLWKAHLEDIDFDLLCRLV